MGQRDFDAHSSIVQYVRIHSPLLAICVQVFTEPNTPFLVIYTKKRSINQNLYDFKTHCRLGFLACYLKGDWYIFSGVCSHADQTKLTNMKLMMKSDR